MFRVLVVQYPNIPREVQGVERFVDQLYLISRNLPGKRSSLQSSPQWLEDRQYSFLCRACSRLTKVVNDLVHIGKSIGNQSKSGLQVSQFDLAALPIFGKFQEGR